MQDQLAFGNGVFLTGALRNDRTDAVYASDASTPPNRASFTTPHLGAVWQLAPNQAVYAQYQDAVSANNGRDSVTRAAQKAERASQIEIGHKIELFDGKLSSTMELYQLVKRDRGGWVSIDRPPFYNTVAIGKARSRGLEWHVSGEITKRLSLIGSCAYTDTWVTEDPAHQDKVGQCRAPHRERVGVLRLRQPVERRDGDVRAGPAPISLARSATQAAISSSRSGSSWGRRAPAKLTLRLDY